MTNACIAYDRYNVITRPFEAKLTKTKALFITFLIWGYTIPWAVLPVLEVWGRYVPGDKLWTDLSLQETDFNFFIFRGLLDLLHLWLPDQHLRQSPLCGSHIHLQLCDPNVDDYLLLQSNRQPRCEPWENSKGTGKENECRYVAIEPSDSQSISRSENCESSNYNLFPLCGVLDSVWSNGVDRSLWRC